MSISDQLNAIITEAATLATLLYQKGWAEGNAGNISVNITDLISTDQDEVNQAHHLTPLPEKLPSLSGQSILISGAGTRMRQTGHFPLQNLVCIRINDTGSGYSTVPLSNESNPAMKPTSELPAHLAIHTHLITHMMPEKAILHTHVNELIALTLDPKITDSGTLNQVLVSILPELDLMIPKGIGLIPHLPPGSVEIARATLASLLEHDVILWARHGVVAIGTRLFECLDKIEIVTKAAAIYFLVRST